MPTTRPTSEGIIAGETAPADPAAVNGRGSGPHLPHGIPQGTVAVAFTVILLVLATTSQGAYAISRWAPLALFSLAVLIGAVAARRSIRERSWATLATLGGIWGLAVWALLSMLWAKSPANAFLGGDRAILYAAIATLPFALPVPRRSLAMAAWAITIGIGAIAVYVLIRLLAGGESLFLAGRLNGPVNYRNATALLFVLPFWPLVVATATKSTRRSVRAAAFSVATLCLGLSFLTQSRGIVIGLAVGGCVALALGPDRVRRAWVAVLSVAGVAAASPLLLRPFHAFHGGSGFVTGHDITVAAQGLAVLTVVAFGVGLALALFDNGLRANSPQMRHVRQAARVCLGLGVLAVIAAALLAAGNPVTYAQSKWDEFRSLRSTTPTSTRLLSTGGQRYDLWRVAVKEFESAPVLGVGSDNYSFEYYRQRRTDRNLNDPHSLAFALLSENGLVGVLLFLLFIGGIGALLVAGWRRMDPNQKRNAVAPAAAGAALIGQSLVDWIWLIPGLTAVGVLALSLAGAQAAIDEPAPGSAGERRPSRLLRASVVAGLLVAMVSVLALFLSDTYIQRARTDVAHPSSELAAARMAARFDPWSLTPHYLQASAYESMGDRARAFAQLRKALSLEPQNFATLGVIGDFEARDGHLARARRYYRRALALDPLDTGLQQLARLGERHRASRG